MVAIQINVIKIGQGEKTYFIPEKGLKNRKPR
jgi:hypothetical protein